MHVNELVFVATNCEQTFIDKVLPHFPEVNAVPGPAVSEPDRHGRHYYVSGPANSIFRMGGMYFYEVFLNHHRQE